MTTLRYISDSARFNALCYALVIEAFASYETVS